jgi:tetratricopeptide (TPR) repeat protein
MDSHSNLCRAASETSVALDQRVLPFAARILPWLLAGGMLVFYGLTLNHWVSPESVGLAARLQGSSLSSGLIGPATYLLTCPLALLPPQWVPLALNCFTAVCAALTLGLLARSVALLPHELDKAQRPWWIIGPPTLMTGRTAWLPPVAAVLMCGWQLSFWQNARSATGEMINLLLFAWVIRCLLEFNVSRRDSWLLRGALVLGLASANDWAMAAFFPLFLAALIWVKRLYIFNGFFIERLILYPRSFQRRLLWQIPACWLAGASLFLLTPLLAGLTPAAELPYWPALLATIHTYQAALTQFPRRLLEICLLVSIMPLFLISLRFYHFLGGFGRLNFYIPPPPLEPQVCFLSGVNRVHIFWGNVFFQLAYGFFLLVELWTMFDSPLSPRRLDLGTAGLPVYFLGALAIGYFAGHFLLTAQNQGEPTPRLPEEHSRIEWRDQQIHSITGHLKRATLVLIGLLCLGAPVALLQKNLPTIALTRTDPCGEYIRQLEAALPAAGAVVICGDVFRLDYLQSALIRDGRDTTCLLVNPAAISENPGYLASLNRANPQFGLAAIIPIHPAPGMRDRVLTQLIKNLAATHAVLLLPPAPVDEPYTEFFAFQPRGPFYQLEPYVGKQTFAGPVPSDRLRESRIFWRTFAERQLPGLVGRINPPPPPASSKMLSVFWSSLYYWPEADQESIIAGAYYAVALNDWGVELQRSGQWEPARQCFAGALALDPFNAAAQINQKFNADHLAGRPAARQKPLETARSMNEYRDWRHVVRDGAVDEPNFCYLLGTALAEENRFRPAIAQYERVKALAPARLDNYFSLVEILTQCRAYSDALVAADQLLTVSPTNQIGLFLKAFGYIRLKEYHQAIAPLNQLLALDPGNHLAQLDRGIALRNDGQYAAARRDYAAVIQFATNAYPAYLDLAEMADEETNPASARINYQLFLAFAPPDTPEIAQAQTRLKELKLAGR